MEATDRSSRSSAGRPRVPLMVGLALCAAFGIVALGCTTTSTIPPGRSGGVVSVVAAENFWGSIASQLGGTHARVVSVISNPNTDPHDYEPTVQDAKTITTADLVIFNGVGYDPWAARVLAASPNDRRVALDVGRLVGVPAGGNPHRWYSPNDVQKVIDQTTADYKRIDSADAAYFEQQRRTFETVSLAKYTGLIQGIRSKYAGTPIGASESIVVPLAEALGLKMMTPETFLNAISEGTDPTSADKAAVDAQIESGQIRVFIYNRQNSTPDVLALVNEAKTAGIPVVTVTETLEPATVTFQDWQASQLVGIQQALGKATGR